MPLKLTVADLNEVSEALRTAYRQRTDGAGFILDVEGGVVSKQVHDEFRTKNVELMKQLKALGDLTPEQVQAINEENATLKTDLENARKSKDKDVEARITALTSAHEKKIGEITKQADGYRGRLEQVMIDQQVTKVAAEIGAHPTAIDDIAMRVRSQFKLGEDGSPIAVDAKGEKIYGEDGKALTVEGAVRQLTTKAPHLFKASSGGGASNAAGGAGRSTNAGGNPWAKGSWNVTEQMRIEKSNAQDAVRLQAEAGVKA